MKQGFTAGCGIEVTMKIGDFEFVKPNYYAGVTEEWDTVEDGMMNEEELEKRITHFHKNLRKLVEDEIDVDIYDIKQVKLYQEILNKKGGKK
jgi:hypothetical protein